MANQTLQWSRDIFYSILKEVENSSAYPIILVDSLINSTQRNICAWNLVDLTTGGKQQIEKTALPFLFQDSYYTSVQDTTLDTTTSIWATTLSIADSTWLATSGKLWINENIITYTGNTGTWLTWVTWILFAHIWGSRVAQLFDLPTDYATPIRVIYDNRKALRNVDYRNMYLELNNNKNNWYNVNSTNNGIEYLTSSVKPFYTIIQGKYLLPFQYDTAWRMIHLLYEATPTMLVAWTDELLIPENYADAVPYIAVAKILYNRWEEDRALKLWNFWLWEVISLYSFYGNQNNEDLNNQRITTWKDQILII